MLHPNVEKYHVSYEFKNILNIGLYSKDAKNLKEALIDKTFFKLVSIELTLKICSYLTLVMCFTFLELERESDSFFFTTEIIL